ncbi:MULTISPECIES: hypothetical protein [Nostoc]|uniref:hypothetical protein n=1 Tax=Nostoc TaxID=1177 RepID=UPI001F54DB4E|nr:MULTISPECIES: hypothetical protein [Nostoc]
MSTIVSRLDITQIFCDVDDFCKQWENLWQQICHNYHQGQENVAVSLGCAYQK